jgi:hypothetical protein
LGGNIPVTFQFWWCDPTKTSKPLKRMIRAKYQKAIHARYGWNGLLKTSVLRSTPWALSALWNWIYARHIEHQVNREQMVVKFWNQLKTVEGPPEFTDRYVRPAIEAVTATHQYGTPALLQRRKNLGACLF